ncbi:MAG TPA: hypothetical protein VH165_25700 [Kofleriaceae bacterium]|nr:hypothetical protein [Kofleriaceae bacterium]
MSRVLAIAITITWLVMAGAASTSHADGHGARTTSSKPWADGVSETDQRRALQLFEAGNTLLSDKKYSEALDKYEQALKFWDHPSIRYNIAICFMNMRQPLAAWEHLEQALRFGEAPLGERLHTDAMTHRATLESSLAELTVKTSQPHVTIAVDGNQVVSGPGEKVLRLLAGRHQVVGTAPGLETDSRALDLPAGSPVTAEITLKPEKVRVERENYERRFRWWIPWAIAGGGVVSGLVGGGVYLTARSNIRSYDSDFAAKCPDGCTATQIPASLTQRASSARRLSGIGIGFIVTGGAALLAGGALGFLNSPQKIEEHGPMPTVAISREYIGAGIVFDLH